MQLKEIMADKPKSLVYVANDAHIAFIYDVMKSNQVHHIAVLHHNSFLGLIDQEALLDAIMISPQNFNSLEAKDIMRRHIPTVNADNTVEDVVTVMRDKNLPAVPYFEDGRCQTLITRTDLLRLVNEKVLEHENVLDRARHRSELAMTNPLVRKITSMLADIGI
jgi:predicted transcriptional regulator